MKKLVSAALSAALLVSAMSVALTANAVYDLSNVGTITSVPDRFKGKEAELTQKYKEAYEWATKLHAQKSNDGLFDFGNSSGENLHAWSGTDVSEDAYEICNQDFDGGNSTSSNAFSYNNWAAIICADAETLNVVVMRDAPAEDYAKGGGVNNLKFGDPVTNQYWRMENGIPVLYQQFKNGYYRAEEGETWYANFYNIEDEGPNYVEPPKAPDAYGDIYAVNEDGCSWENPKYFPENIAPPPDHNVSVAPPQGNNNDNNNNGGGNDPTDPNGDLFVGGDDQQAGDNASDTGNASETTSTVDEANNDSNAAGTASGTSSGSKANANNNDKNDDKATSAGPGKQINWGATIGLIAGGVVVVGGGVFCLYWFVLRKKKVAEGADAESADGEDKPDEKK